MNHQNDFYADLAWCLIHFFFPPARFFGLAFFLGDPAFFFGLALFFGDAFFLGEAFFFSADFFPATVFFGERFFPPRLPGDAGAAPESSPVFAGEADRDRAGDAARFFPFAGDRFLAPPAFFAGDRFFALPARLAPFFGDAFLGDAVRAARTALVMSFSSTAFGAAAGFAAFFPPRPPAFLAGLFLGLFEARLAFLGEPAFLAIMNGLINVNSD